MKVSPGKNLGVSGAVGPIASLEKKSSAAVEPQIGLGATTAWKLNAISDTSSVVLFFRPVAKDKAKAPAAGSPLVFQVTYRPHSFCLLASLTSLVSNAVFAHNICNHPLDYT
jgi:protein transport protein SEC23